MDSIVIRNIAEKLGNIYLAEINTGPERQTR